MYSFIISCVAISLVSLLCYATLKYGIEIFHKNNIKIKFKILNKSLIFKAPEVSGKYEITIPYGFHIRKNDEVKMSFDIDRGCLTRIRELYVNDTLIAEINSSDELNLKKFIS